MTPDVHYTKSGDVHIAYMVFGEGPLNLVWVPGFISHVEHWWDEPGQVRWYQRLGTFARIARGWWRRTSDRSGPDFVPVRSRRQVSKQGV